MLGPLALIAAGRDLRGVIRTSPTQDEETQQPTDRVITVYGFKKTEVSLAIGDDQLRCAVQGSLEGAPCALALDSFDTDFDGSDQGFANATWGIISPTEHQRVYLVRRKHIGAQAGDYEALIGFDSDSDESDPSAYPIIGGIDERIAAILEPSADGCARPRKTCDGAEFDERIPLEDALTDDGTDSESSWRHYLNLAREAADRADALGVDYVQSGLQQGLREEELEVRREQQRAQAESYLKDVQRLCGVNSDTRSLLKAITGDTETIPCGPPGCPAQPCAAGYTCQMPPEGNAINGGTCLLDLDKVLEDNDTTPTGNKPADPDIERIKNCLDTNKDVSFVSLGTDPLCLWHSANDKNKLCLLDNGTVAPRESCPIVRRPSTQGSPSCQDLLGMRPAGTSPAETKNLGYFSMTAPSGDDVDIYRKMREALALTDYSAILKDLRATQILDPERLSDLLGGIDYQALPGEHHDGAASKGFGAITYQGSILYKTGDLAAGFHPEMDEDERPWPCGRKDSLNPGELPAAYDCAHSEEEHEKAKGVLLRAVLAAKTLRLPTPETKYDGDGNIVLTLNTAQYQADGFRIADCASAQSLVAFNNFGVMRYDCPSGILYKNDFVSRLFKKITLRTHYHTDRSYELSDFTGNQPMAFTKLGRFLLAHDGSATTPVSDVTWDDPTAQMPWVADGAQKISLTVADYVRALGLIGAVGAKPPVVDLTEAPRVRTIEDLESASQYLEQLAAGMRNSVGMSIFSKFPTKVADALRNEEATGAFPQFGGELAVAISNARGALLRIRENGPLAANEIAQLGSDIRELKILLRKAAIGRELSDLQFMSTMQDRLASCATSMANISQSTTPWGAAGAGVAAAVTCANSISQIGIASDVARLQSEDSALNGQLAVNDFGGKFAAHATSMQSLALHLAEAQDDLDSALANIENIRAQARSALVDALAASTFEAKHQAENSNVIGTLASGNYRRYSDALHNARRMGFLAKRAIEQRLGVTLADLTDDYPLVEAPQKWESTICTFSGINYAALAKSDSGAPQSYAGGFIGEYVTKLENFVESYRLEHNFAEGRDTAVISLRDDIMNVKSDCLVDGPNLLFNAGQIDEAIRPGWTRQGCPTEPVGEDEVPAPGCIAVTKRTDGPVFPDSARARTSGFDVSFGSQSTSDSALVQELELSDGVYRMTWYTQEGAGSADGGDGAGVILGSSNVEVLEDDIDPSTSSATWKRRYKIFRLAAPETVGIGFKKPATGGANCTVSASNCSTIAAPMLERLPDIELSLAFAPFVNTTDSTDQVMPACVDRGGGKFRSTRWTRACVNLCVDGFADNCAVGRSKEYCYRQTEFGFSQRDIQLGKVFNFSGFARGNFNYRIDSVGLNFVGTGIRACEDSAAPEACYGGGFVPFSLSHQGPFFVRNHTGADVQAHVFDGNIEHGRGLATERYLTSPLSDADRSLMDQYTRREFAGRPLDGNFVLRVWEEDGVDFSKIEDVQIALNYRYWTRSN
jgi:hypothetical protein